MRSRLDRHGGVAGFSLLEVMVAVAIVAVIAGIATFVMGDSLANARARDGVRALGDLMAIARQEAIRTGENHLVFFEEDAQGNALNGPAGAAVAVMVRDADADGIIDAGEVIGAIYPETAGNLQWGSTFAANLAAPLQAPNDNAGATFPEADPDFICCTFLDPGGNAARWVAFLPDGIPRAFSIGPFTTGPIASGSGGVYVTSGNRDYSAVLAPLGGVRVHAFERSSESWTD